MISLFVFAAFGVLLFMLMGKSEQVEKLHIALNKLKHSFTELDEQAKLIVKTDLELNRTQEELDKRLNGLDALQKISRQISTTLDEAEIFRRLDQSLVTHIGFEKGLVFIYDKNRSLNVKINLGFSQQQISAILSSLQTNEGIIQELQAGRSFSSTNSPKPRIDFIVELFDVAHFLLSPILSKNGLIGVVFVGNKSVPATITEGDEELISILANQIGQSLENARLFEEVFHSQQTLENKIQDRTKQLEIALDKVQTISKTKSEFISAVSHELRTPLTSVKGYASILLTGKLGEIPQQAKERLEKINLHSDNLVQLINNLLDISRIESGRVEMKMEKCNIKNLIENIHDLLTPQMKDKEIQWKVTIDERIPEIIIDQRQVERIFINLIGNAVKFTPKNGTIGVKASLEGPVIKFEVSDTGIGISEKDIAKLFDEFYRVDNEINQTVKGTGLGLPLARKIVEAHGGKMWITSKLNEGTTFHFTLAAAPKMKSLEETKES